MDIPAAEVIESKMTEQGMPLRSYRIPGICCTTHIMGDFLPKSAAERQQRKEELLRACRDIRATNAAKRAREAGEGDL